MTELTDRLRAHCDTLDREAAAEIDRLTGEVSRLEAWVDDLQSGMYINCVYCGHQYGPQDEIPASMAAVLKEHVEQCPKHPMSQLKTKADALADVLADVDIGWRGTTGEDPDIYYCEYCDQSNAHWILIEHSDGCVVSRRKAALTAYRGG